MTTPLLDRLAGRKPTPRDPARREPAPVVPEWVKRAQEHRLPAADWTAR